MDSIFIAKKIRETGNPDGAAVQGKARRGDSTVGVGSWAASWWDQAKAEWLGMCAWTESWFKFKSPAFKGSYFRLVAEPLSSSVSISKVGLIIVPMSWAG